MHVCRGLQNGSADSATAEMGGWRDGWGGVWVDEIKRKRERERENEKWRDAEQKWKYDLKEMEVEIFTWEWSRRRGK